jgi:hypothetical protein
MGDARQRYCPQRLNTSRIIRTRRKMFARRWPEAFDRLRPQVLKRFYTEALVVNL